MSEVLTPSLRPKQGLSGHEWIVSIAAATICFLHCSAQGLIGAVIPNLLAMDISRSVIGLAVTFSAFVAAALGTVTGAIVKKISARRTMMIGSIAAGLYGLCLGLINNVFWLFVAQFCMSFLATLGTYGLAASILSEHMGKRMGPVFGVVAGIANFGNTFITFLMG